MNRARIGDFHLYVGERDSRIPLIKSDLDCLWVSLLKKISLDLQLGFPHAIRLVLGLFSYCFLLGHAKEYSAYFADWNADRRIILLCRFV